MRKRLDIQPGTIFNKLEFIEYGKTKELPCGQKALTANCKCECGNIKENILVLHLVRNNIKSCGCLNPIHNMRNTKLHTTWRAMCNRVKETYSEKKYYFDKGITLFESWKDFRNFRDWAILNNYIDGLQIDRIDNSKGYYPNNCRFVTRQENLANRDITIRCTYKGEYLPIAELARKYNKNYDTVYSRVKNGKSIDYAIETPVRQFKKL